MNPAAGNGASLCGRCKNNGDVPHVQCGVSFIISQRFGCTMYVSAPPGYAARPDGTVYRDGTDPHRSGPEWNRSPAMAYRFQSHRAAARVANTCTNATIHAVAQPVPTLPQERRKGKK